jgi:hypothetical protein
MQTPLDISYLSDAVLMLRYFEADGRVRRAVSVVKKRSGAHEASSSRPVRSGSASPGAGSGRRSIRSGAELAGRDGFVARACSGPAASFARGKLNDRLCDQRRSRVVRALGAREVMALPWRGATAALMRRVDSRRTKIATPDRCHETFELPHRDSVTAPLFIERQQCGRSRSRLRVIDALERVGHLYGPPAMQQRRYIGIRSAFCEGVVSSGLWLRPRPAEPAGVDRAARIPRNLFGLFDRGERPVPP